MSDAFSRLNNIPNTRTEKKNIENTGDPQGLYPKPEYWYRSSLSREDHQLSIGGGDPTLDIQDIMRSTYQTDTDYTEASIKQTASGHVLLFDDKDGSRRILLKHENGTGIEMRNDGTMVMRTENNIITSVGGSGVLMVEGDLKVSCKNMEIDATGDLDMRVNGDYNLSVGGHKKETIDGSSEETITGNKRSTITGGMYNNVVGNTTNVNLGNIENVIKGNLENTVEGNFRMSCKGSAEFTSQHTFSLAAPNFNITSEDLSVVGAGGTLGGENMIYYGKNYYGTSATFTAGVTANGVTSTTGITAPAFHGDLNGIATSAVNADHADTARATLNTTVSVSAGATTATGATNTGASEEPTAALMQTALKYAAHGYRLVNIDFGDGYKNKIDLTTKTGGITNRHVTLRQIRTKLKDPANAINTKFLNYLVAENLISDDYIKNKIPPGMGRSYDGQVSYISHHPASGGVQSYLSGQRQYKNFIPDSMFDPRKIFEEKISGKFILGSGIPLSTFLINGVTLGHIANSEERLTLASQLLLQAEVFKFKKGNQQFKNQKLTVTEGIYKPFEGETLTEGSIPFLAQTGRAIVYELHDENNKQSEEVSFNFATRLAESLFGYDKIILDYDTLEKDNLNIQIIVIMPEIDADYNPKAPSKFEYETRFNNKKLSNTDLIEIVSIIPAKSAKTPTSKFDKVIYANKIEIRDRPVASVLEEALDKAAVTAGLDYVTIISGKQPGTDGKRVLGSSTRHDTGLAADVRLTYKGNVLNAAESWDREVMVKFVKAAIANGILGGGHGPIQFGYMSNTTMHLDMLGANVTQSGGRKRGLSHYDKATKFVWSSDDWFKSAFGIKDA